jgi:predicted metal-dependent HD superfamily phosphohydrolase
MNPFVKNGHYDLWNALGRPQQALFDKTFRELVSLYGEGDGKNGRYYHTLEHIEACLAELNQVRRFAEDPKALEVAIWFHDAIYDTHRSDNEEQSAEYASRVLTLMSQRHDFIARVHALIMATKHNRPLTGPDEQLIADIDLSGFGQDFQTVETNSRNIRKEYKWVPTDEFNRKRLEILRMFLNRQYLYFTPRFRSKYEASAKENLAREIAYYSDLVAIAQV